MIPTATSKQKPSRLPTLVMLARAPLPGTCKTRLHSILGPRGAARIQAQLIRHRVRLMTNSGLRAVIEVDPDLRHPIWRQPRMLGIRLRRQANGSLGERMKRAVRRVDGPVLIIGSDCPALDSKALQAASAALATHSSVAIPAHDGGYVLIGLRAPCPRLFHAIDWGSSRVWRQTQRQARQCGLMLHRLPALADLDEPSDYRRSRRFGDLRGYGAHPPAATV